MNMKASIAQLAVYHGLPHEEAQKLKEYAEQAATWIKQLRSAAAKGDGKKVRSLAKAALRSYAFKVCGVMRDGLQGLKPVTLLAVEERAAALNPFRPIKEAVMARLRQKHDGNWRITLDFNWKRRALINVAACVLDTILPRFDFDYLESGKGRDNAITYLKLMIDSEDYQYVVTADIKNCFGSAIKKMVANLLPIPAPVTRHVLLIENGVEVEVRPHRTAPALSLNAGAVPVTDEAARLGLPQGSAASSLIMRRAVLGPVLAQLPFAADLVLYQDDVAVAVKTKGEANAVLEALKTTLSSTPAGPLAIGQSDIRHIEAGFVFLGYRVVRKPPKHGGHLHVHPAAKSYARAEEEAHRRYVKAGGGRSGNKAIISYWRKDWRPAWPLWKSTPRAAQYQRLSYRARVWPKLESGAAMPAKTS
ncbi:reverse transcriptase domain-containing protein [Reyranella sp.]|uniref:reverse transcriptase domain-containing protein n=1 Tax=Reyranella sp. TaxID=1929291 RepID=UPI003D0DD01C